MSANPRPPAKSIADFRLKRSVEPIIIYSHFDYLQPFVGTTTTGDWNFFTIDEESGNPGEELLGYATSLPLETYQVFNAQLVDPDGQRFTDMRLHEMIRSTWAMESDTELRRLGIHQIENSAARTAIENEFESAISGGANPAVRMVTVSGMGELSPYWQHNPFTRCAVRVAGDRTRVIAHLIKKDNSRLPRLNMVCELDTGVRAPSGDASSNESYYTAPSRAGSNHGDKVLNKYARRRI